MGTLTQAFDEVQLSMDGAFAEIYEEDNLTAQSIPTGATYTKITNFQVNGDSKNCTADKDNNKITVTELGEYKITFSTSFTMASGSNTNWFGACFIDGVEQSDMHFERKIGSGGDYGSTSITGIHSFTTVPQDVDVRFKHDGGGSLDLVKRYMNLNVTRIGGTP